MKPKIIYQKIFEIRNQNVMLDFDLAILYDVETRALKQAIKRNTDRFPKDFMFQLTEKEIQHLVSQNVIPSKSYLGGAKPYAFTEQGVAMLASILKSKKAVQVNISIIRAFVTLRNFALNYKELAEKINFLERKYNKQFKDVFEALNLLLKHKQTQQTWEQRQQIGFKK